jgi:hypothetical protein
MLAVGERLDQLDGLSEAVRKKVPKSGRLAGPRLPPEFLEEKRSTMGQPRFAQEYLCEFIDDGGGCFSREMVERA